jgi:hypothetical protein
MVVADFNKDGKNDLIGFKYDDLYMIKNIAVSSTTTIRKIVSGPALNLSAADMNKDGYPDIVANYTNLIFYENEKGVDPSFTEHLVTTSSSPGIIKVIPVDMNQDGFIDIVAHRGGTAIYWNNCQNPTVFSEDYLTTYSYMFDVCDFNFDGLLDILTLRSSVYYCFINNSPSSPRFTQTQIFNQQLSPSFLYYKTTCDIDQDGDLDFAGAQYNSNTQDWYLAYLENTGGWPPSYQYHLLKALDYPLSSLIVAPLGVNHRWQFIACQGTPGFPGYPSSWLDIYDAIPLPRNNCSQWKNYP